MVPEKRIGSWGTKVSLCRRVEMSMSFKGWESIVMLPDSGRVMERIVEASVDFPLP
jgi:hypothetical protein